MRTALALAFTLATAPVLAAAPSGASDDFNRPAGTDLGEDWTEMLGDTGIVNGTAYGITGPQQWMLHSSFAGDYSESIQTIEFLPKVTGFSLIYVALICGYDPVTQDCLFVKVQDNNYDGYYDTIFFYRGVNGGGWGPGSTQFLAVPTASGRLRLRFDGDGDVALVDLDRDLDGSWDETFQCSGIHGSGPTLGTGFGIGSLNSAAYDNWSVEIGAEPGVAFCFGDPGSGTPCPCGNDNDGSVPGSGCGSGYSTSGARLTGSGVASVSEDSLVLSASGLEPNQLGLYFQADHRVNGGDGRVFGDGLRCAGGGLVRLQLQTTTNSSESHTNVAIASRGAVVAGETKRYQCWYRTTVNPPCGIGVNEFNLTNGYEIVWAP